MRSEGGSKVAVDKKLSLMPGPHIRKEVSIEKIMYLFSLALMLPAGASIFLFGRHALFIILTGVLSPVFTEYIAKRIRRQRFRMDGSALITGLLLALTLPPRLPLWMVALGAVFAIAVAKEAFGGLGYNIFNPALAGRAFLTACFPKEMTRWVLPFEAVTSPTPLNSSFVWHNGKIALYKHLFLGNVGGSLGETSALLILIAGFLLLALGIIDWRIPLCYIGTVALLTFSFGKDPLFHVLAGGLMFGAFFMATDYVTTPITGKGRIIFAVGAGVLTVMIRLFGGMPEGVCFSILLMNAFTPLIDRYVRPRPFGWRKTDEQKRGS